MNLIKSTFRVALVGIILTACGSGTGPAWTYAPLGPTPAATTAPSAAASPGASPGVPIEVATSQDAPLSFIPNVLNAPPATVVTVTYINNSTLEHNINFFNGPDNSAPSLGATEVVPGPNAPRSVTFTTPEQPGDYYFWCDVHFAGMAGTLRVAQ